MPSLPDLSPIYPSYYTQYGNAYLGDALDILQALPEKAINLVITSPPFALVSKKEYGNKNADEYVDWFCGYAREVSRVLTDNGSFVVDIGGVWNKGRPTRSLYQYKLLISLCEEIGFHLAQEVYWYNPGAIPAPAQWVNIERVRLKSAVNSLWWLSPTPTPKADNRKVLSKYSDHMQRLLERGVRETIRPSGYVIKNSWKRGQGSIPPNIIAAGNNDSMGGYIRYCRRNGLPIHPARFPEAIPDFFIRLCTDEGDIVLDPFAGSNMTGQIAEELKRRWIAVETCEAYVQGSVGRFSKNAPENGLVTQGLPTAILSD